ncbi:TPA: TonB-dependent siderophore receptor [Serratia rubidaea]|uniref:TonB-dependent siderophore receptor n=1 Tax=Serratia rubidaea TaxID=61652 RepID=UPI0023B0F351|nr:TonB-dependent siderophore receptor [Serratia rubidaea]MDK1703818.1 TonB-dependent siderophore receptor [Serratia rubidaea]HDJ1438503.1 TonB-dependent siderophore receptor [Serratia rubidaea]HDJ1447685.1 TonB-dependent siderophore receptor [Serratia rubidaea]HDJ1460742.1 TonB-dependent siderophore receptor [Serratia rubidaea]HDJ2771082.1 TonB-dependent siderophore receptor [Serratia rubidaea]
MNNYQRGWLCAIPLAAGSVWPAVGAETPNDKSETMLVIGSGRAPAAESYQPLTSVTGTRSETSLLNVPQAVDVVPTQVLTDRAVSSLDEALYNVSGITQSNTLGGTQDAVMKRGFGDNRDGSILRDGVRSVQARNFTPTTERVEVLKGPASMLYGMGEPGGMINMISKKPQLQQHTHVEGWGSSFKGGGGQLDVTGPLGTSGFAYRMIVDHDETDYWRNFGRNRQTTIAPSLMWYGESTTVRLAYEHMEYLTPFDRGTIIDSRTGKPVNTPRDRRFDEAYNATRGDQDSVTLQIDQVLNDRWKSSLTYAYNRNSYSDNQARATKLDPESGTLTRQADATAHAVSHANAVQLTLNGDVDWGRINHQLLFGFDFEDSRTYRGDMIRGSKNSDFNIYDPVYGQMPPSTAVSAKDSDQRENLTSYGWFMQDSVQLTDNWLLMGGLRYDTFDVYAGKGRPFNVNTDSSDAKLVPRAGVVYKLTPYVSLYGSYTESFKPNSSIATQIGSLPPEQGKSWEMGGKVALPNGITGTLALFDITKRNVMVSELVDGESVTRTAGRVRSQGVELDVAGNITDSLSLIGAYAYTDARVVDDPANKGKEMANVARHTASLFLTQNLGSTGLYSGDELRVGAGARYVGRRPGDAANSFYLDNYTVADAFAAYSMPLHGYRVKWQLNVNNLFDKTYYPSSGGNLRVAVGEPREVVLRASVDF